VPMVPAHHNILKQKHKYELENNKRGKPKRRLDDFFVEVQYHTIVIPTSPLRKLELLIWPTSGHVSFNHFPGPLALLLYF
jgi:hypothetical protein